MKNTLLTIISFAALATPALAQTVEHETSIALKTAHGRYVFADINQSLQGHATKREAWETFTLERADGSRPTYGSFIRLRTHHGRYVVARADGSIGADAEVASYWEEFIVHSATGKTGPIACGDEVGLRTYHNTYVVAEDNHGMLANRAAMGGWETFTVECTEGAVQPGMKTMHAGLRTAHGRFIKADPNGSLLGDATVKSTWETFTFEAANRGDVLTFGSKATLRTTHGTFLWAQPDGVVRGDAAVADRWEGFVIESPHGRTGPIACGDEVALRSYHGQFLAAEDDDDVYANRDQVGSWETFVLTCETQDFGTPHDALIEVAAALFSRQVAQDCALQEAMRAAGFRSISVGFGLEAASVHGVGAEAFVARPLEQNTTKLHVYGGLAASVGMAFGVGGYIPVGFWTDEADNLSGNFAGVEVSVVHTVGVKVGVYWSATDGHFLGFVLAPSAGAGADIGISAVSGVTAHLTDIPFQLNGCGVVEMVANSGVVEPVAHALECATEVVVDATSCGIDTVSNAAVCGWDYVTDATQCGSQWLADAVYCGVQWVDDAVACAAHFLQTGSTYCPIASSCDVPNSCWVGRSCDVARTCEVTTCE